MNQESRLDLVPIKSFTDLRAWQEGHKLKIMIYKMTDKFPKHELFGLSSQIKRASSSITSNIAEGFTRQSYKEKVKFYYISHGSLTEVQDQLLTARDVGYIDNEEFNKHAKQTILTHKIISGLIKKSKSHYS